MPDQTTNDPFDHDRVPPKSTRTVEVKLNLRGRRPALPIDDRTTVRLDTSGTELKMLRDVVIRAHEMTGRNFIQSPEVMRDRTHRLLDAAIDASPVLRGFLGRGGPCADRDFITGSGDLS